jgi:hypothetical protein
MRIRRTSVPALMLAVAALAAGCGGSEVPADEVPGGPVTLTVPVDEQIDGASSSSANDGTAADATADATADDSATTDDTTTDQAAPADDGSGTAAPSTTDDGGAVAPEPAPATDEPAAAPDTGGTSEFCEQNAGAC